MSLWGVGASTIIYLAGLQGIPTDLYEAAEVDGANGWVRFWNITLPMMTPVLFFTLVTGFIAALQVFTQAFIMTSGRPQQRNALLSALPVSQCLRVFPHGLRQRAGLGAVYLHSRPDTGTPSSSRYWVYYEGEDRKG